MQDLQSQIVQVPIRVRWHGWESDTYRLRQSGWNVFGEEHLEPSEYARTIQLALTDRDNTFMIVGRLKLGPRDYYAESRKMLATLCDVGIEFQMYKAQDRVVVRETAPGEWSSWGRLSPIDGFANVDLAHTRTRTIAELPIFTYKETSKEIYLPPPTVSEYLDKILSVQYPEQKILQANKRIEQVERPVLCAKIYSLAA